MAASVQFHVNDGSVEFEPLFAEEICSLSEKLSRNKSVGIVDIPVEVYKYETHTLFRVLACLFIKMLSTSFLPSDLMRVLLVPMIKNKTLLSSDSINCRSIVLPTAASKLFELIQQSRISPYMWTSDVQFGFKASHGTDMVKFSFKEILKIYLNSGSNVFVCFLDLIG